MYDRILDLRIATPQIVINYAMFLEEHKYFEESFKVREACVQQRRTILVPGPGDLRLQCGQGWSVPRPLSSACGWPSSYVFPPVCLCLRLPGPPGISD